MVLPEGFALPPPAYLLGLLLADGAVLAWLYRRRPPVDERTVTAFVPWMAVGAALHATHTVVGAPAAIAPLLGTPAVYMSVFAVVGGLWWGARRTDTAVPRAVGTVGLGAAALAVGGYLLGLPTVALGAVAWAAGSVLAAVVLAVGTWLVIRSRVPTAGLEVLGPVVLASHALDGLSTAVGVEVFGFGERTPAARVLLEIGGALPVADLLGTGWLFVAVKLAVAAAVVWLFAGFVREDPLQGYLLLGVIAAVGLGPGTYNLLLMLA